MFLYSGYDFVHSWDLNCEEVRRRETGFALGLGCFLKRKANRDTCGLKSLRLSRAAICLSPGLRSLECAFSVSHCLHPHCASVFISAEHQFCFCFGLSLQFSQKSQSTLLVPNGLISDKRGCDQTTTTSK